MIIKFKMYVTLGLKQGSGYSDGRGPYDCARGFALGGTLNCIIRPRVGMPEYDLLEEMGQCRVDILFDEWVAHNVPTDVFEEINDGSTTRETPEGTKAFEEAA